jgi:branched-chain amino acid transport system ATP-binding protein
VLKVHDIHKSFGEKYVLKGISFELEKGKIYTLTGGNGTGKTTLFNIITGFIKPDKGFVEFNGINLTNKPSFRIYRLGISRSFQDLRIVHGMTVRENILLAIENEMFHNSNKNEINRSIEIIEKVSLIDVAESLAGEISYGQQKLLTVGCCIANHSDLLLIDEPVAGIDSINYEKIKKIILQLKSEGKTILQIEHNQDYIEGTSDLVYELEEGKLSEHAYIEIRITKSELQKPITN